jgi:hypothetical protein
VQKAIKLVAHSGHYRFMTMSNVEAADAAGEIDVAVAVYVFEPCVFGFRYVHGGSMREAARNRAVAALGERFGFWARDWGS